MRNPFKKGWEYEGLLTNGTKANRIVKHLVIKPLVHAARQANKRRNREEDTSPGDG